MQTAEHTVEVDESGRHAVDFAGRPRVDQVKDVLHQFAHRLQVADAAVVVDRENPLFRLRDQLFRPELRLVSVAQNPFARFDQLPSYRVFLNDFGVPRRVRRYLHRTHQLGQIRFPADLLQLAAFAQLVDQQRKVDPGRRGVHFEETPINASVRVKIKIVRTDDRRDVVAKSRIEHNRPDDAPLRFEIVRRNTIENGADRRRRRGVFRRCSFLGH